MTKKEVEKTSRITQYKQRLLTIYSKMDSKKLVLAEQLIENAAFMEATLEDCKNQMNKKGVKEKYKNGEKQWGYRESIEAKNYNTMIKNYMGIIKQLNDMLPDGKPLSPEDEFDLFNNVK